MNTTTAAILATYDAAIADLRDERRALLTGSLGTLDTETRADYAMLTRLINLQQVQRADYAAKVGMAIELD